MSHTVLVCGSREAGDRTGICAALDAYHAEHPITRVISGGADGVDAIAWRWAVQREIDTRACAANWDLHGKSAGPIRNQQMIDLRPDAVLAFPGGKGTADTVARAERAGILVVYLVPAETLGRVRRRTP